MFRVRQCALALAAVAGCTTSSPEIASVPLDAGFRLQVARRPMHPVFAEYVREARLYQGDSVVALDSLLADTGGYGKLSVYDRGGGEYLMRGPLESYRVSTSTRTIARLDSIPRLGQLLGTFDSSREGDWTFIRAPGK